MWKVRLFSVSGSSYVVVTYGDGPPDRRVQVFRSVCSTDCTLMELCALVSGRGIFSISYFAIILLARTMFILLPYHVRRVVQ